MGQLRPERICPHHRDRRLFRLTPGLQFGKKLFDPVHMIRKSPVLWFRAVGWQATGG